MKQHKVDTRRPDKDVTGAEPLAGSGFEQEQPETEFNADSEHSGDAEPEDEQ